MEENTTMNTCWRNTPSHILQKIITEVVLTPLRLTTTHSGRDMTRERVRAVDPEHCKDVIVMFHLSTTSRQHAKTVYRTSGAQQIVPRATVPGYRRLPSPPYLLSRPGFLFMEFGCDSTRPETRGTTLALFHEILSPLNTAFVNDLAWIEVKSTVCPTARANYPHFKSMLLSVCEAAAAEIWIFQRRNGRPMITAATCDIQIRSLVVWEKL
ncbi:unnamed protein product [Zymoseptoria tritici ST99CH_3D1]|nr:unnamed protein product [Zymoseptoria tritici ST99CH_3D1]